MTGQHPHPPAVPRRNLVAAGLPRYKGSRHSDPRRREISGKRWRSKWVAEQESATAEPWTAPER